MASRGRNRAAEWWAMAFAMVGVSRTGGRRRVRRSIVIRNLGEGPVEADEKEYSQYIHFIYHKSKILKISIYL